MPYRGGQHGQGQAVPQLLWAAPHLGMASQRPASCKLSSCFTLPRCEQQVSNVHLKRSRDPSVQSQRTNLACCIVPSDCWVQRRVANWSTPSVPKKQRQCSNLRHGYRGSQARGASSAAGSLLGLQSPRFAACGFRRQPGRWPPLAAAPAEPWPWPAGRGEGGVEVAEWKQFRG